MKNVSAELTKIVNNKKVLSDKNSKFKYSTRAIYAKTEISSNYNVWIEGSSSKSKTQRGIIDKYELKDGIDYVKVFKNVRNTIRQECDYMVTLEVYCFLVVKYNLIDNIPALELLQEHIEFSQSEDNAQQIMAVTGRNDIIKVLNKFNLI